MTAVIGHIHLDADTLQPQQSQQSRFKTSVAGFSYLKASLQNSIALIELFPQIK